MKKIINYKKVCKNGILQLIQLAKEYEDEKEKTGTKNTKKLNIINNYIENVINKDKSYYSKISKMLEENTIKENDLKYLL